EGKEVTIIDKDGSTFDECRSQTIQALHSGPAYIYQAALAKGPWAGFADFLERVDRPSELGAYCYEVADTKLKRSPAPVHLTQLCVYSSLLGPLQGLAPERMHIVLGDGQRVSMQYADYAYYVDRLAERLTAFVSDPPKTQPEPVAACARCR